MIRRHVGIAVVLSILAAGLAVTGCGDDETSTTPTPQPEAGVDATPDQSTTDAKQDAKEEAAADVATEQAEDVVQSDVIPDTAPEVGPEADAPPPPPSGIIQVLTINDFHGQLDPVEVTAGDNVTKSYYGGMAYLSSYFKQERVANPNTIVLNGGDEVGASPTVSAFGTDLPDEPAVLALRYLGLTASNLGNHNFDRGTLHLKKLIDLAASTTLPAPFNTAPYRYVGTNIKDLNKELGDNLVKPYHMIDMAGIKVAIIGISNTETPGIVTAGSMGTVVVEEPVGAANDAAAAARAAGAHVVLGTAHIGANTKDPNDPSGQKYAGPLIEFVQQLQGFDFVQGGHTEAEFYQQEVNGTWVAQGPGRGHAYYKVQLTVTDGAVSKVEISEVTALGRETKPLPTPEGGVPEGGLTCSNTDCPTGYSCLVQSKPICEKVYIAPDPAVAPILENWKQGVYAKFDVPIGTIDAEWKRDGKIERSKEVPLGDMISDAILQQYKPFGAQIAFMNGGGIRDSLPSAYAPKDTTLKRTGCTAAEPCDLVLGDVYSDVPFGNAAVLRSLTGLKIKLLLEHSLSALPVPPGTYHGKFQQVSGMEFSWDSTAESGARVSNMLLINDSNDPPTKDPIDGNDDVKTYKVIVNDFMNGGGDGFTMLQEPVPTPGLGILADAVLAYIKTEHAAGRSITAACPGLYQTPEQPCRVKPIHWPLFP